MNHSPSYLDPQSNHISTGPSYGAQSQTAGGMSQYQYQPQAPMQSGPGSYTPTHATYPSYYGSVTSPQAVSQPVSAPVNTQLAPIPAMNMSHNSHYGGAAGAGGQYHTFDSTGQVAPPGVKPRVTATLWEDEGSLCFQVEAKGICVARREDNHFINGTKLLNVAGMTRGRRDGILKSEKVRHVVKIGPMHLKGVWIPFDRALDFANREKITELLYPLFVHNIGALLYHPTNSNRTSMVMEANAKRRQTMDSKQPGGLMSTPGQQPSGLMHHHSMSSQMPSQLSSAPHSLAPHPNSARPGLDRAHTFPTPPTSASSLINASDSSYNWSNQNMNQNVQNPQPLAIDTSLSNSRSMPSTPATTPPAASMHNMSGYQNQQSYDSSRPVYSAAPQAQSQYANATQQQNMARFGQPMGNAYIKGDMGPPSRSAGEGEEIKQDPYSQQGQGNDQVAHTAGEDEGDHEHDGEYGHDANAAYNTNRSSYSYAPTQGMGPLHGDHGHISQDQVNGSPHQNGSGRVTPRTSVSQSQWPSGYNTPPRSSSSLYNVMSDNRGPMTNGHPVNDGYNSSYPAVNGNPAKRGREDDDDYKGNDLEALKRRKSGREGMEGGNVTLTQAKASKLDDIH